MKYLLPIIIASLAISSTVSAALPGPGGATRAFNVTSQKFDFLPQCFPWTFTSNFRIGNI